MKLAGCITIRRGGLDAPLGSWRFVGKLGLGLLMSALIMISGVATAQDGGGMEWEKTTEEIATDGVGPRNVSFRFKNTGERPIIIQSVSTSCGCTVIKPEKREYGPGEVGVLPVTHKPLPGGGVRSYRINVQTDEGGGRQHTLFLRVTNQPRFALQPRVVTWEQGEQRGAKKLELRVKVDDPSKVVAARADKDVVDVSIIDEQEPGRKTVVITPKAEMGGFSGRVRVQLVTEPAVAPSADSQFFVIFR